MTFNQGCGSGLDPDSESGYESMSEKNEEKMHFSLTFITFL
jgi:hypothetical protein